MAAAITMIAAASCVQELANEAQHQGGAVVYKAITDGADTKAVLGTSESGRPQSMWEKGDKITIHNGQQGYEFTTSAEDGSAVADFVYAGDDFSAENGVIAVYPAGDYDADIEARSVMVTIPAHQQAVENSYDRNAVPAVAYSTDNSLHFYNAGALLKFTMNQDNVSKVRFYANESIVTGSYYAVCRAGGVSGSDGPGCHYNYIPDVPEYNIDYAELDAPDGETFKKGSTYYISAMPNGYPGFHIEFFGADGSLVFEKEYNGNISLRRNSILNLGLIGSDTWKDSTDKMYVVGTYNDWRLDANLYLFDIKGDRNRYEGVVDFNAYGKRASVDFNEFKLTGGAWGVDEFSQNGYPELEAPAIELVSGSGNNINVYQDCRFYHFTLDKANCTLTMNYAFNSIGVIGDFCAWSQDVDMNYNPETQKFWVDMDFAQDGEMKFRADDGWELSFGYDYESGHIVNGGENISYTAGQYRVYLDMNNLSAMTCEFNSDAYGTEENAGQWDPWADEPEPEPVYGWSLIGGFNDWNGDVVMTEVQPGQWEIKDFVLEAGQQWKLREDGRWDSNYGGPGEVEPYDITIGQAFDATWFGVNMTVSTSGVYDIYFNENDLTILVLEAGSPLPEPITDREKALQALTALYNSTNGDNWKNNTNWLSDAPLYEWYGMDLLEWEDKVDEIYRVYLDYNNLCGTLPVEFTHILSKAKYLMMHGNGLHGVIPQEVREHPKWQEYGWNIIMQNPNIGGGFDFSEGTGLKLNGVEMSFFVEEEVRNSDDVFDDNELTLVVNVGSVDEMRGISDKYVDYYKKYKNNGLGMIVTVGEYWDYTYDEYRNYVLDEREKGLPEEIRWIRSTISSLMHQSVSFVGAIHLFDKNGDLLNAWQRYAYSDEWYLEKVDEIVRERLGEPEDNLAGEGDYIDEYGINHGPGVEIDGVVWAPVNCGYHETDFPWGKLYQWGRKYGQGYADETYADASQPVLAECNMSILDIQSVKNESVFYTNLEDSYLQFNSDLISSLWNVGTEENPVKSEYDPCPENWRLPTSAELSALVVNRSDLTNLSGQTGMWFSGYTAYDYSCPQIYLQAAGLRWGDDNTVSYRNQTGSYRSSKACDFIQFWWGHSEFVSHSMTAEHTDYGNSVRCVQDDSELVLVEELTLDKTEITLSKGESYTLSVIITPSNANHQNAFWYSDNPDVATVDENGVVTAVAVGIANITAVVGMQSAVCEVTVVEHEGNGRFKVLWEKKITDYTGITLANPIHLAYKGGHLVLSAGSAVHILSAADGTYQRQVPLPEGIVVSSLTNDDAGNIVLAGNIPFGSTGEIYAISSLEDLTPKTVATMQNLIYSNNAGNLRAGGDVTKNGVLSMFVDLSNYYIACNIVDGVGGDTTYGDFSGAATSTVWNCENACIAPLGVSTSDGFLATWYGNKSLISNTNGTWTPICTDVFSENNNNCSIAEAVYDGTHYVAVGLGSHFNYASAGAYLFDLSNGRMIYRYSADSNEFNNTGATADVVLVPMQDALLMFYTDLNKGVLACVEIK